MHLPKQFNYEEHCNTCLNKWSDVINKSKKSTEELNKPVFTITMPPPNRNGSLHMGHQYNLTIQDALIRYNKLKGNQVLFVPGTDHGGISVENMATKELQASGRNKSAMPHNELLDYLENFASGNKNNIINQIKKLGCYCDWEYEAYTKSPNVSNKITQVFVKLYKDGLIYKDYYIVNYCASCKTCLSDDELEKVDVKDKELYFIKYAIQNSSDFITVATTKPETMFADVAVAVHPDDERYAKLQGSNVLIPLINKAIPIITDISVDKNYGTGCVKITPAHDKNDFKISQQHPAIHAGKYNVIDTNLNMINTNIFDDVKFNKCRDLLIVKLQDIGQLEKVTKVDSLVHKCYRCASNIQCLLSNQYFIKIKRFINHVRNSHVEFYPPRNKKILEEWLNNCVDWCISRQINWGHRIPIYKCNICSYEVCSDAEPSVCQNNECSSKEPMEQITDVLDTWFSSGMWPFIIFDKLEDLNKYFPSSILVTGGDIIFFWVARMIMFSRELYGVDPFKEVFLHGPILGTDGKKMGKSKGNVIDPETIIKEYGVDVLRFSLLRNSTSDIPVALKGNADYKISRALETKLWNLMRYVLTSVITEDFTYSGLQDDCSSIFNDYILYELSKQLITYHASIQTFDFMSVSKNLYNFTKDTFCNDYLEVVKLTLTNEDKDTIIFTLICILQMLHPLMPFVTETCWSLLSVINSELPTSLMMTEFQNITINNEVVELEERIQHVKVFFTMIATLRELKQNKKELIVSDVPNIPNFKELACGLLRIDNFNVVDAS